MKFLVFLMVAILAGGVVFTAYSVMSYDPPNVSQYLSSLQDKVDDIDFDGDIDEESQKKRNRAVSKIKIALEVYNRFEEEVPKQAKPTIQLIIGMIQQGKLPSYFIRVPGANEPVGRSKKFDMLDFSPENYIEATKDKNGLNCEDIAGKTMTDMDRYELKTRIDGRKEYVCIEEPCPRYEYAHIIVGDGENNRASCDPVMKELAGDQIYVMGPGNDIVDDKYGNKIVNGGTGDDVFRLGSGRKIIVFEEGWGNDEIDADCVNANVDKRSVLSAGAPVFWKFNYTNFIVFGPTVNPSDIEWESNQKLVNKRSGDSIVFKNNKCFNFVYAAEKMGSK